MKVNSWGTWSAKDKNTWHDDSLIIRQNFGSVATANLDVNFDGTNYVISNIKGTYGNPGTSSDNLSDLSELELGNSAHIYLTVSAKLIKNDRSKESVEALDHSKDLDKDVARNSFEEQGKSLYPYGFKCHWILDLRAESQELMVHGSSRLV